MNPNSEQSRLAGGRNNKAVSSVGWRLVWLLYPTVCAAIAQGQDALFSSVSLDTTLAANSIQPADRPHWGPVQFALGGYGGVAYDDNINGSQRTPESDVISQVGANLNFDWPATDHTELQFGTGIGYLNYQNYSANSGLEVNPDSALMYAISMDDVILTLFDQFSYSREVRAEAALANVVTLPQLDNNAGIRTEWHPGQWTLLASYSHDDYVSDHANDYLNRSSEYFFARAGWRFAEATQAGLEASDGLAYYQAATQNNNQNLSAGAYLEWKLRPSLQFTLRGGSVFYEPDSSGSTGGGSSFDSYYVGLEASHQLTGFLSHNLSINRSLQAGVNQGGGYIEQLSITYSIAWMLTQHITVRALASYADGKQPLEQLSPIFPILIIADENYQQYDGGLQVSWQCTGHTAVSVDFNHWLRNSNLPDRSYSDNSVSFQLNYNF